MVIDPSAPEPEDSLYCAIQTISTDADGDPISYDYAWYINGILSSETTNVLDDTETEHGDTVECECIPNDGEDDGTSGTVAVTVNDGTAPDPPLLDDPDPYINEDHVEITGTCEADCDLTFYFSDATGGWSETNTCASDGTLAHTVYLTRGYSTSAYATCTDAAGNTSGNSNTVTVESCSVEDTYENSSGYGDSGSDPINEWSTMVDDGSTSTINTVTANALNSADEDWYIFSATDAGSSEERFNFQIQMASGSSTYTFDVFKGSPTSGVCQGSTTTCASYAEGCTEFEFYNEDNAVANDGASASVHSTPGTSYLCGGSGQNQCPDYTDDFYVKVTRNSSASASCDHYELEVSMTPRP